jgi:large subunit ribosomal protein L25
MSTSTTLTAFPRTVIGKSSHRLASAGQIPAILYGAGRKEALAIAVDRHDFEQLMSHHAAGSTLVELELEGDSKAVNAMIREMQTNPIKGTIVHVDFLEVSLNKPVHAVVAVKLVNDPAGVRIGGVLTIERHEINIEAKPGDLPNFIEVDVSALEIGDSLHVGDITPPKGVTLLDADDAIVASVVPPTVAVEEEEVAEEAEPEVIGAKDEEE